MVALVNESKEIELQSNKLSLFILFIYEFLSRIASSVLKVNCYQRGSCVGGSSAFNSPFGHRSRSRNICSLDNHLWFNNIALKLGAQLSILITIFQVFGMTRLWLELTTFWFWWRALYLYTTSRSKLLMNSLQHLTTNQYVNKFLVNLLIFLIKIYNLLVFEEFLLISK